MLSTSDFPRREGAGERLGLPLIGNFLDADPDGVCPYISAGIYGLTPKAIDTLNRCMAEGKSRMRNFQRGLIEDGLRLLAFPFSKVLDIDHAKDVEKAEEFLRTRPYSPFPALRAPFPRKGQGGC